LTSCPSIKNIYIYEVNNPHVLLSGPLHDERADVNTYLVYQLNLTGFRQVFFLAKYDSFHLHMMRTELNACTFVKNILSACFYVF